jgi:hypothetical protein
LRQRTRLAIWSQISEQMPRTLGNTLVPLVAGRVIRTNRPPTLLSPSADADRGRHRRTGGTLVPDGATLQMGISASGRDAAGPAGKHKLGIHTEMF